MSRDKVKGKHAAAPQVLSEGIGKDAQGNTVFWQADENGGWTPVALKKHTSPFKIAALTLCIILALLAATYAGGWWFFSNHLFPNTSLSGIDLSYKTTGELVQIAESIGGNYTIVIKGNNASFTVAAKDVAAGVDGQVVAQKAINSKQALSWPLEMAKDHDISNLVVEEFSVGGLEDNLRKQVEAYNETAQEPENAFIEFDAENKRFTIHPETQGTKLMVEPVLAAATDAAVRMETEIAIPEDAFVAAEITRDNETLIKTVDEANNYCKANIELVLGDTAIHATTIDSAQISQWVSISDDYKVNFDEGAMNTWIEDLAKSLNTVGTEREFVRPTDNKTFVVSGGSYGWEIDNEALVEQVRNGIKDGLEGTITVPTFSEGYTWNGAGVPDWGAYAEVDLSAQHARFFNLEGKCIWESDIISGQPDGEHDTTTGIWRVLYTESPSILRGEMMSSGVREYETQVQYWMQFTNSGIGFHDAVWQWAFGGNSYAIGYGSHGCVNLPYSAAEELFGIIEAGNAVIVHW